MKATIVAGAALTVLLGAVLTFLWGSSGPGSRLHAAGVIIMLAGLAGLVGVLVRTIADLRRTGRHRRSALVSHRAAAGPALSALSGPRPPARNAESVLR